MTGAALGALRESRWGKWAVAGRPLLYLVVFCAIPTRIMVAASFRSPGEFGGLAPFVGDDGRLDLTLESYVRLAEEHIRGADLDLVMGIARRILDQPIELIEGAEETPEYRPVLFYNE